MTPAQAPITESSLVQHLLQQINVLQKSLEEIKESIHTIKERMIEEVNQLRVTALSDLTTQRSELNILKATVSTREEMKDILHQMASDFDERIVALKQDSQDSIKPIEAKVTELSNEFKSIKMKLALLASATGLIGGFLFKLIIWIVTKVETGHVFKP